MINEIKNRIEVYIQKLFFEKRIQACKTRACILDAILEKLEEIKTIFEMRHIKQNIAYFKNQIVEAYLFFTKNLEISPILSEIIDTLEPLF